MLVTHDLLGLFEKFIPKFVKQYAQLAPIIKQSLSSYITEVKDGTFPDEGHSFHASGELQDLLNGKK